MITENDIERLVRELAARRELNFKRWCKRNEIDQKVINMLYEVAKITKDTSPSIGVTMFALGWEAHKQYGG
jgi:hypothetical protein